MATAHLPTTKPRENATQLRVVSEEREAFHRIREVREEQGISLRTASRRLGVDSKTVRAEEDPDTDLNLSRLYDWQEMLDVPLTDLLNEPDASLSRPVEERAKMVRVMKTAMSILSSSDEETPINRLATMLVAQLGEIMPELNEVSAWHTVGQRRSMDDVGKIAESPIASAHLPAKCFDE